MSDSQNPARNPVKDLREIPLGAFVDLPWGIFTVDQVMQYTEDGYSWWAYRLQPITADEPVWLSVELDDEWIVGVWNEVEFPVDVSTGFPKLLTVDGVTFTRTEQGKARASIRTQEGNSYREQGTAHYADYTGKRNGVKVGLSLENYPGEDKVEVFISGDVISMSEIQAWTEKPIGPLNSNGTTGKSTSTWRGKLILYGVIAAIVTAILVFLQFIF